MSRRIVIAADLGDPVSATGIAVVAATAEGETYRLDVLHLELIPARVAYAKQAERLANIATDARGLGDVVEVALGTTAVGKPVADLFRRALRASGTLCRAMALPENGATAAASATVRRRDLIDAVIVELQAGRLHMPDDETGHALAKALGNYRHPGTTSAGGDTWREHDDDVLVLALGYAVNRAARPAARPMSPVGYRLPNREPALTAEQAISEAARAAVARAAAETSFSALPSGMRHRISR